MFAIFHICEEISPKWRGWNLEMGYKSGYKTGWVNMKSSNHGALNARLPV
jgi:hypothetical protein